MITSCCLIPSSATWVENCNNCNYQQVSKPDNWITRLSRCLWGIAIELHSSACSTYTYTLYRSIKSFQGWLHHLCHAWPLSITNKRMNKQERQPSPPAPAQTLGATRGRMVYPGPARCQMGMCTEAGGATRIWRISHWALITVHEDM